MTKIFTTLMVGAALVGATPAFAGSTSSADIFQEGGGLNTLDSKQRSDTNDLGFFQDGEVNRAKIKQRGDDNRVEGGQVGLDNDVILRQGPRRK